jgi:hypothetical protein
LELDANGKMHQKETAFIGALMGNGIRKKIADKRKDRNGGALAVVIAVTVE